MKPYKKHLLIKGSTIKQALERLDFLAEDAILFVVDDKNRLIGSLTDGDVRRGLLKGFTIDHKVEEIIQSHPKFIRKGEKNYQKIIEYRENNFKIIPVLSEYDKVVNVINFRDIRSYLPVDAVIMAGGKGERLKPLTDIIPKPLLKVGDKPILGHNLDRLRLFGIDDIWITLNHKGIQIEDYFGDGKENNITIQYIHEEKPLGTIGAITKIRNFKHDNILVTNSDLLTNINYENFFLDFIQKEADFSVLTIPYCVDVPYAIIETSNGLVLDLKEKPTFTYYSNGGIYLMNRDAISHIPNEISFDTTDLISILIKSGKKVISYPLTGYWLDIGRLDDYKKAQRDVDNINFK